MLYLKIKEKEILTIVIKYVGREEVLRGKDFESRWRVVRFLRRGKNHAGGG